MNSPFMLTGRDEVVVRGDGNCFYRAVSLWKDGNTDRNHTKLREIVNKVLAKFPDAFEPFLFMSTSVTDHVKKSQKEGTWAETVDIVACATLFQRTISMAFILYLRHNG